MRRPLAEVLEETVLALPFGTKFENLLLPKKVDGEARGDGVGEFTRKAFVHIARQAVEKQGVASFVGFDQFATPGRVNGEIAVLEIIDAAFKKRMFGEK